MPNKNHEVIRAYSVFLRVITLKTAANWTERMGRWVDGKFVCQDEGAETSSVGL